MEFYIDLGSSTIKVYRYEDSLQLLEEHSIYFKNGFSKEYGVSTENKEALYQYFSQLKEKYDFRYENTHIFVTGIFRELSYENRKELVLEFNRRFDLHFEIISHNIENYYIGKAMENDYQGKKVMIINMGGKTTELVTFVNNQISNRVNLKIGVGDLLNEFPQVNDEYSSVSIEEINSFVKQRLTEVSFDQDYDCAIFTGGEERFELLTDFSLVPNTLFQDGIHSHMIDLPGYIDGVKHVFFDLSLDDLYHLMPQNPKWMDGARAGAILPLAIFELASIPYIVPSDLNLIHGVIHDRETL